MKHFAEDLGISQQTVYTWRRQRLIDTGERPGITTAENAELASTKRRIRDLEEEVQILVRARELLQEIPDPKSVRGHHGNGRVTGAGAESLPNPRGF